MKIFILAIFLFPILTQAAPGDLDPAFGSGGIVTTAPGPGSDRARAVALQADGKIVVTGWSEPGGGSGPRMLLVRYNSDGSLDTSFGTGGVVTETSDTRGWAVAIQPDGKIVVGGTCFTGIDMDTCVWRFNTNGTPDTTFNATGRRVTTISFFFQDEIYAVALQIDGKIVAVGRARHDDNPDHDFLTLRYHPDGSLDTTWDSDGIGITPMATQNDIGRALAIQADGKIVVAGEGGLSSLTTSLAVARFNTNGSLDTGFDGDGKLFRNFSNSESGYCVTLQTDGKIVVGGILNSVMGIFRFDANGATDSTFGGTGRRSFGFNNSVAQAVQVQTDGKIVTIGHGFTGSERYFAITRVLSDASDDTVFGPNGFYVTTSFGPNTFAEAHAGLIQPDGKILAVGYVIGGPYASHDFALARYIGAVAPSAARVAIGGRVENGGGSGIGRVTVILEDPSGETRVAITNAFGYFRFDDVEVGRTYLVSASHKRYSFASQTVQVQDEVTDLTFVPEEAVKDR